MAVWLIRAGSHGEYEQKFLQEKRVYVTWERLAVNLAKLPNREALLKTMTKLYPDSKPKRLLNWVSQLWPFAHDIKNGDMIILPLKSQRAVNIGEVTGDYRFEASGPDPFYHWRSVKWIGEAIPRVNFGQDLLYSFGAFMTICRIRRNNAEARLLVMRKNKWKPERVVLPDTAQLIASDEIAEDTDLEESGRDEIVRRISERFTGHGLTRLVEALLKAKGYTTYQSPEGPDGGVDILASAGPLGFGSPQLCVQVKSGNSPIPRSTVDNLLGVMSKFHAMQGLFVSWSGFKGTVQKQLAGSFFKLRLWSQNELLEELFAHYDQLDEDIRAELRLKRIWTVAAQEDE
jgi:restriction system protein